MRLREWMDREHYTAKSLGIELGAPMRSVEKWTRGERFPRPTMAIKIIEVSNGEVSGNDLIAEQVQRLKM
jgi:hypothetical protein